MGNRYRLHMHLSVRVLSRKCKPVAQTLVSAAPRLFSTLGLPRGKRSGPHSLELGPEREGDAVEPGCRSRCCENESILQVPGPLAMRLPTQKYSVILL